MKIKCCTVQDSSKSLFSFESDHPPVVGDLITHNSKNYIIEFRSWLVSTHKHDPVTMAVVIREAQYVD